MKKVLGMLVLVMVMLCGTAVAAEWENTYPKADENRLGVTAPEGLKYDLSCSDGYISMQIRTEDMSKADWKSVMIQGGYPYVWVRPYVEAPAGYDTCIAFNGAIFDVTADDFFRTFVSELSNDGIWDNNHIRHSNGESVGEIVADQCMFIPQSSTGDGGGGFFIAWMDKDKYREQYPDGHQFTVEELRTNTYGIFFYEYVELSVRLDAAEPFYVPFRSLSAATMAATESASMPAGVEVKSIVNGDITYSFSALDENVDVPLVLTAPEGAAKLWLFSPYWHEEYRLSEEHYYPVDSNGTVTYHQQIHADSYISEELYTASWYDEDNNVLDYGVFWLHSERTGYLPSACYVKDTTIKLSSGETKTITWEAPESSRVRIVNNCESLGVKAAYDASTGIYHTSYDEVSEVTGDVGNITLSVRAPSGATYARFNGGGGNNIMGPDSRLAQENHNIITEQSYAMSMPVDSDGYLELYNSEPLRHYAAGPVDVYIQSEAVWTYGGGQHVIYWYKDEAAAESDPENPMKIEYVVNTADTICVTTRTEIVESEDAIKDKPVDKVTCVSPNHHGKDWHLVIRRHPQRGDNACHWELYLENECGDYEPLDGETVFYMPYPNGHSYDHEHGCARDKDGNEAAYEIYHYNASYDSCDEVTAQPTEYGIRFVTKSLSPFVLDWGGYEGDLTPDQGGGEGGNEGGEDGEPSVDPEWPLQRLDLRMGKTTVEGARIRDVNVSTRSETIIEKSKIANLAVEYRTDDSDGSNKSLRIENSWIGSLFLPVNEDTPASQSTTAVMVGQDSTVEMIIIPIDANWSGTIETPLIAFEEGARIQLLILEENWKAFDPGWLNGVTIVDVEWPDNTTGQPVPYEEFLEELN